jgi:transposase
MADFFQDGKVVWEMVGEKFQVTSRQLCWSHLRRDFQAFAEREGRSQRIGEALLFKSNLMFQW